MQISENPLWISACAQILTPVNQPTRFLAHLMLLENIEIDNYDTTRVSGCQMRQCCEIHWRSMNMLLYQSMISRIMWCKGGRSQVGKKGSYLWFLGPILELHRRLDQILPNKLLIAICNSILASSQVHYGLPKGSIMKNISKRSSALLFSNIMPDFPGYSSLNTYVSSFEACLQNVIRLWDRLASAIFALANLMRPAKIVNIRYSDPRSRNLCHNRLTYSFSNPKKQISGKLVSSWISVTFGCKNLLRLELAIAVSLGTVAWIE